MLDNLKRGSVAANQSTSKVKFSKRKLDQSGWTAGVFLRARANGERIWVQRIIINGMRREFELGNFPEMTMTQARNEAETNKNIIAVGGDVFGKQRKKHQDGIRDRIKNLSLKIRLRGAESATSEPPEPVRSLEPVAISTVILPEDQQQAVEAIETSPETDNTTTLDEVRALGPNIDNALMHILNTLADDEDGTHVRVDMLTLAQACGPEILDKACASALEQGDCSLWSIVAILDEEVGRSEADSEASVPGIAHGNIRGPQHFH
jgi:hypothetical protein